MNNELWNKWSDVHESPDQLKRLSSSKDAALTPISIDRNSACATIPGKHGTYHVTLESCECSDFKMRQLPCKHIYRLAIELGFMDEDVLSYTHGGYSWKQAVEILEKYPENIQRTFYDIFYNTMRKTVPIRKKKNDEISFLVSEGLLIDFPEKETPKFITIRPIEDFFVNKQKLHYYFSRKFSSRFSEYIDTIYEPEPLPEDDVTAFLRDRGFVE